MAPLCLASHLSLFLFWILLSIFYFSVIESWSTTFVYDRQMMLDIKTSVTNIGTDIRSGFHSHYSSFQMNIPEHLHQWPTATLRKKHRRKRGKHGGTAVRLKAGMVISTCCSTRSVWDVPLRCRWIQPIVPSSLDSTRLRCVCFHGFARTECTLSFYAH